MSDWIAAVDADRIPVISEIAHLAFDPDALCERAAVTLGRDPAPSTFGRDDFREPLSILCEALEEEAALTTLGRWITHRFLDRLLQVRIQIVEHLASDPGVEDDQIAAPVFVVGAPRTGTTRLHGILAAHPDLRAPRGWELLRPLPPPLPDTADERRTLARFELGLPQLVGSGLSAIHHYDADMHKECLSAMSPAFRSEELISRYRVPSYASWLARCDMTPAYTMHRTVLRILQRRWPATRWVLKSPVHLGALTTLRATYPDAGLVVTHRDPYEVLGSVDDLIATLRRVHSDDVDLAEIEEYHVDLHAERLNALADRLETWDACTHVRFEDFVADEVGTSVRALEALDVPVDRRAVAAMRAHAEAHPPDEHGTHRYDGPRRTRDDVAGRFGPYLGTYLS